MYVLNLKEPKALSLLVIVPCLNEEQTVHRVVSEVPREIEGIGKIEVCVIDDGSTDGSRGVISRYGSDKVRAIYQENCGQFSALCRGVREARYDIICFCDSDDTFTADKLQVIYRYFA